MPKGIELNDNEKGQIIAFKKTGLSNRQIARRLGRSKTVVWNFLKKGDAYGEHKRSGRPSKLNKRLKRRILNDVTNKTKGCRTVRAELAPNVSHQTVWRAIKESPNLVRQRMKKFPCLKQCHKEARIAFAEQHVWWTNKWKSVILAYLINDDFHVFRSFSLTKNDGVWMGQMVFHRIGGISEKNHEFFRNADSVVEAS